MLPHFRKTLRSTDIDPKTILRKILCLKKRKKIIIKEPHEISMRYNKAKLTQILNLNWDL